jgi:DNA-binding XRE family transcriptional regulator
VVVGYVFSVILLFKTIGLNSAMYKYWFSEIRHELGKSQAQLAQLLSISVKAVQSFEQGWRRIPIHVERQLLFLLSLKRNHHVNLKPCWNLRHCPKEIRDRCPAWEFKAGHLCWFINGTYCNGEVQKNWQRKIEICLKCEVFQDKMTV